MLLQEPDDMPSLTRRAEGDLQFIRAIMQRTSRMMPMPGWSIAAVGLIGLLTAWLSRLLQGNQWVLAWCVAATSALLVTIATSSWQVRHRGKSIIVGGYREFWSSLWPAFFAAGLLTLALMKTAQFELLSGTWLLCYGVGVLAASRHTVVQVAWLGYGFLLLGIPALFLPWSNLFMGLGFGFLHLLIGYLITRSDHD